MPDGTAGSLGEDALVARVVDRLPQGPQVLLGPGDDAAVVGAPDGRVVATTDLAVEGVHFRRDWSSAYDVGRKTAAANLADVMAMGGTATALLVGLVAPPDLPAAWADGLADGLRDEAALVGASVVGGDTVRGERLVVSVTALGDLGGRRPVRRVRAELDPGALPRADGATLEDALHGGEDHGVLATVPLAVLAQAEELGLVGVGRVREGSGVVGLDGAPFPDAGWRHFAEQE